MSDLIKRQDVIDFLKLTRDSEYKKSMSAECKHKSVIRSKHDAHVAFCDYLIEYVKQVPTHPTPSNTLGALDCVERQKAIDESYQVVIDGDVFDVVQVETLMGLPSVQPERKRGKWRRRLVDSGFNADWHCSECGWKTSLEEQGYNFCPNCGCRMEEGDSEWHLIKS